MVTVPTSLLPAVLGVVPSPLKAYVRLLDVAAPGRDAELALQVELGLGRFMAGTTISSTPASRPPLVGRQSTIVTAQGLLVPVAVTRSLGPSAWPDDHPPVWLQVIAQAEMWLHGHTRCQVGVFSDGLWRAGWIGENAAQQKEIVDAAEDMARRVAEGRPPAPDAGDLAAVKRIFPDDHDGEVRLTREHAAMVDRLRLFRQRSGVLAKRAAGIEAKLRYAIGGHRIGVLPDGQRVKLAVSGAGRRLVVGR